MSALQSTTRLDQLANHSQPESISIIMPTEQSGRQVQQNAIRFKNLLNEVVAQFVSMGHSQHAAEERITVLREYQRDDTFWQHQSEGLALYFCDGQPSTVQLQHSPEPLVTIADHYFITPVAADSSKSQQSSVLTVTWEEAKLYDAVRGQLAPHDCEQFPVVIRDVVLPPDPEEQLQVRTQRGGGGRFWCCHVPWARRRRANDQVGSKAIFGGDRSAIRRSVQWYSRELDHYRDR